MLAEQNIIDSSGIDRCLRGNPPPCACKCYFDLDIRNFIAKLQRGATGAAFRAYRDAVIFPEIVSQLCDAPCAGACILAQNGDALNLPALERAAIALTAQKERRELNIPPKKRTVAIIGGSLSGLACAQRMSSKGYSVKLFEKGPELGGSVRSVLPDDVLDACFAREFQYLSTAFYKNSEIVSLGETEADALFVAFSGKEAERLAASAQSGIPVLLDASESGASAARRCAEGLRAAAGLEAALLTGIALPAGTAPEPTPSFALEQASYVTPERDGHYDLEKCRTEAKRCRLCNCSACIDVCDLMQAYRIEPVRVRDQILATLKTNEYDRKNYARMADACTFCEKCTKACPQGVDIAGMLRSARYILSDADRLPPPYHDFWISDMENATRETGFVFPTNEKCAYLFFPGCQLGASRPEYVSESYKLLSEAKPNVGLYVSCCGSPAEWAGKRELHAQRISELREDLRRLGNPCVIFACPNCMKHFARHMPEVEARSLYDVWLDWGLPAPPTLPDAEYAVFDPCTAAGDPAFTQSVRGLLRSAGGCFAELPSAEAGRCCGFGGHISISNPRVAAQAAKSRIGGSALPYVTYCANCRDIFAQNGKTCRHVLDILCSLPDRGNHFPGLSRRRDNRRRLHEMFVQSDASQETYETNIIIPDSVKAELDIYYILEEDVRKTVDSCEKSGRKLLRTDTGIYTCHAAVGEMTLWVDYEISGDRITVKSAYSHRMKIGDDAYAK